MAKLAIQFMEGSMEIEYGEVEKSVFGVSAYKRAWMRQQDLTPSPGGPLAGAIVASGLLK